MSNKRNSFLNRVATALICIIIIVTLTISLLFSYGLLGIKHKMQIEREGQIKVACVGDSLTYGSNLDGWYKNNYPVKLQNILGDKYCVNNYGHPGSTVTISKDMYSKLSEYKQSLQFKADIVVMMLGTNDTWAKSWKNAEDIEDFKREYINLINAYRVANPSVRIIAMTPPKAHKYFKEILFDIRDDIMITHINPEIKKIVDEMHIEQLNARLIIEDIKLYSSDKVHLNSKGTEQIAKAVAKKILNS